MTQSCWPKERKVEAVFALTYIVLLWWANSHLGDLPTDFLTSWNLPKLLFGILRIGSPSYSTQNFLLRELTVVWVLHLVSVRTVTRQQHNFPFAWLYPGSVTSLFDHDTTLFNKIANCFRLVWYKTFVFIVAHNTQTYRQRQPFVRRSFQQS